MRHATYASPTLAVLGSLTLDEIVSYRETRVTPGGSAFYVSATSAQLGAKVDVISQVGMDYPSSNLTWLKKREVGVERVKQLKGKTCRFKLWYRKGARTLQLVRAGSLLTTIERDGWWQAVHIGPVFREVPLSLVPVCGKHSSFVSMDLQGFVRGKGEGGKVILRPSRLGNTLRSVDFLKATVDEALVQARTSDLFLAIKGLLRQGPKYLVVTLGGRGSLLAERSGRIHRIPAYPETIAVDPTGAGDAMVGGWLVTFLTTGDPVWAASVGAALASLLVRRRGLAKFRWQREELFRRSAWVYTRIRE